MLMLLLATVSGLTCQSYTCYDKSIKLYPEQCISVNKTSVVIRTCDSSLVPYCQPLTSNTTCIPKTPKNLTSTAWPGEKCSKDSECAYGMCYKSKCNSFDFGKTCALDDQCNPGLFCNINTKTCEFQIYPGESGCTEDTDCWNSAGCNFGKCVPYFSLPASAPVDKCSQNKNYLCQNVICGQVGNQYICGSGVTNKTSKCSSSKDCVSTIDSTLGIQLTSDCKCSLSSSPQSYCKLFPGDSDYAQYIQMLKDWTSSDDIRLCNTQRRFADNCIKIDSDNEEIIYWKLRVQLWPMIDDNEKCTKEIFYSDFWKLDDEHGQDEGIKYKF